MLHLFRCTSAVTASKSVWGSISCVGSLLPPAAGEGDNRLRRTSQWHKHTPIYTKNRTTRCWRAVARGKPIGIEQSASQRRLEEFYIRFYSTISESAQFRKHGETIGKNRGKGVRHSRQEDASTQTIESAPSVSLSSSNGDVRNQDIDGGEGEQQHTASVPSIPSMSSLMSMHDPTATARYRSRSTTTAQTTMPQPRAEPLAPRYIDLVRAEDAAIRITSNLLGHNRLCRDLQKIINQKLREQDLKGPSTAIETDAVDMLRKTLRYINTNPVANSVKAVVSITGEKTNSGPLGTDGFLDGKPYISPMPRYSSRKPPLALNWSLHSLLTRRPIPHGVISKVCFNLLTSHLSPDTNTYNILIRNLTLLRQNKLAELVFHEMIRVGDIPDEYTITVLLELMVKSGDFQGWSNIVRTQKREEKHWRSSKGRVRSKFLMETLIIHSARFGVRKLIRRFIRALKRYWPQDPEPGRNVLVALIRFYSEMKEWNNGMYCWQKLQGMDTERRGKTLLNGATAEGEEILDQYSWYWWLRHCKSCNKMNIMSDWMKKAEARGINVQRLLARGPTKERGLHVRSSNKSPSLGMLQDSGDWWEEREQERQLLQRSRLPKHDTSTRVQFTEEEKRKLLGEAIYSKLSSESAFDPPSLDWEEPASVSENGNDTSEPSVKDSHQESRIWENILSRRMYMLLNRHHYQELKEARGKIRISKEEAARGEILKQWKIKDEKMAVPDGMSARPLPKVSKVYL